MNILLRFPRFAVGLAFLLCSVAVSAQTIPEPIEAATKFDEYGRVGGCDHSARLDNFAIELQNNPNLEGYVVYYGPQSASEQTLGIIQDYLINSRGISGECLKTIYAGPNSDPREPQIQLWVAPSGAPPPELVKYESRVETFNGLFTENERWESIYFGEGEATGPPVPDVSMATYVDILKRRQDTLAYIVAFSGTESAPGGWRRMAERESEELQSKGIPSDRIRTIYGGNEKENEGITMQFWILSEKASPPVIDAGPELPPTSTRQIGNYGDYELNDERGERLAFKILLDGLRTSAELRICIIVHLESAAVAEESAESEKEDPLEVAATFAPGETPAPEPADLLKLIEKWKAELTGKHKISPDRLIVFYRKSGAPGGNSLKTWIVPSGARLPDPNAEPGEELADDATSGEEHSDGVEVKKSNIRP
ncbi:MAG TPA: hypothetical protein VNO50_01525 [Pyrinomonadaceae bacterium]|nr:hypothetical protein [Pyrinomonadaceae bacterium]